MFAIIAVTIYLLMTSVAISRHQAHCRITELCVNMGLEKLPANTFSFHFFGIGKQFLGVSIDVILLPFRLIYGVYCFIKR